MVSKRILRLAAAAAGAVALAGCGGGDDTRFTFTPWEVNFGVAVADLNGDGAVDVLSARTLHQPTAPGESGALYTSLGSASHAYGMATPTAAGTEPLYLAVADLDGDGLPDVVSADFDAGGLLVFLGDAAHPGQFAAPVLLPAAGASQVAIADLNGDGLPDLVAADFATDVFLQDPAHPGQFLAPTGLNAAGANWVAIGDLTGDGLPDVVVTDGSGVKLYAHGATATSATFLAPTTVFTQTPNQAFSGANYVAIADLDGDGLADLVITDPGPYGPSPPTVNVLLQAAAAPGTFLAPASYAIAQGQVAQDIRVADLDGDGLPDIVVGDAGGVSVLLQQAGGTYAAAVRQAVANGAFQLALADIDGDGHVDIVVANTSSRVEANGVLTTQPGVLLQDAAAPGTFKAVQALP